MTREIKFRAWDKRVKAFASPSHIYIEATGSLRGWGDKLLEKDRFILQQYTGLKDKNGKEIYEGDIVKGEYRTYQIEYTGAAFRLKTTDDSLPDLLPVLENTDRIEVIGNIYENPELLK